MKFRLTDADQERLGCPEWLDVDLSHVSLEEAEAIDADGGDWTDIFTGGAKTIRTRVWLGLRRAGVDIGYNELTVNVMGISSESPGKAPSANGETTTPPTSATSSPPTRTKAS